MTTLHRPLLFAALDKYVGLAINLATAAIVARLLTPDEIGVFVVGAAVVMLAESLREFGTGSYIVQRPESHSLHHGRGIHQYNYSDLPLFDILFGTFRNPKEFTSENGFYDGASAKLAQILIFKDIAGRDFDPAMKLSDR